MGERKKLVARISKFEPLILKSKPLMFCPVKTRLKTAPETQTKMTRCIYAACRVKVFGRTGFVSLHGERAALPCGGKPVHGLVQHKGEQEYHGGCGRYGGVETGGGKEARCHEHLDNRKMEQVHLIG